MRQEDNRPNRPPSPGPDCEGGQGTDRQARDDSGWVVYMSIGLCVGVGLGIALDNMTLWMSVGLAVGTAIGLGLRKQQQDPPG